MNQQFSKEPTDHKENITTNFKRSLEINLRFESTISKESILYLLQKAKTK